MHKCICWQYWQRPICGIIETLISVISRMFTKCIFLSTFQMFVLILIALCHEFWILNCQVSREKTFVCEFHGNAMNVSFPQTLQCLCGGPWSCKPANLGPPHCFGTLNKGLAKSIDVGIIFPWNFYFPGNEHWTHPSLGPFSLLWETWSQKPCIPSELWPTMSGDQGRVLNPSKWPLSLNVSINMEGHIKKVFLFCWQYPWILS